MSLPTGLTREEAVAAIEAHRGPLRHELYAAELDLKVAEESGAEELIAGPFERVEEIKRKLAVLDAEESKL
jgi:hypothetical protein